MKARTWLLLGVIGALLVGSAVAGELDDLKKRFKKRYPTLLALKDAGKVGETHAGLVEAVKEEYLKEKADPADKKSPTVKEFLAAEVKDRERLYEILAAKLKTTPDKIAERNAKRNFEKAKPDHYLKLESGKWVKKKDLKK